MERSLRTGILCLLLLLVGVLYFSFLGSHGLLEPDEGRYSEIPREMLESGDWVTPRLNYVKYFEKPVLHYWLTALSFKLFGENAFAARFVPALLALAGVAVTALFGATCFGGRAGFLSGIILGTSLVYFAMAHINIIDMTLTFFLTVALFSYYLGITRDRGWLLVFYTAAGLATLSKGLVGFLLPGIVIFCWIAYTRRWILLWESLSLSGILLFLLVTVPWFTLVSLRNPEFPYFFFIHEHFVRYTTTVHNRFEPWWFFIPILLIGLLPWTGFALTGASDAILGTKERGEDQEVGAYLLIWFLVIFLFFSFSKSKLVPYILPVFPPLALLAARSLDIWSYLGSSRALRFGLFCTSLFTLPFAAALVAYPFFQDRFPAQELLRLGVPLATTMVLGTLFGWFFWYRRRYHSLLTVLCLCALLQGMAFKPLFRFYGTILSAKELADIIQTERRPGDLVADVGEYHQGLPFYLKERILLVDYLGELEFGYRQENQTTWFLDRETFRGIWEGENRVLMVLPETRYERLLQEGFPPGRILGKAMRNQLVVLNRADGAQ